MSSAVLALQIHKRNFALSLQPFLEMLADQQGQVSQHDWMKLVENLASRVIENPEQYLGQELPPGEIISQLVLEILEEFTEEHKPANQEMLS